MSIPDWTYSESYYQGLLANASFEIRTDPVKGKGLFAKRAYSTNEVVLKERALCCSQNLDEFKLRIPVCGQCLASLEAPKDVVKRLGGGKLAKEMPPPPKSYSPPQVYRCRNAGQGCTTLYCSEACEQRGWLHSHLALCTANMTDAGREAFVKLQNHDWVQDGVDLTDTHFLALRFIAHAVARSRHGMPLEEAYGPISQLIRAPITKFAFTYLIQEEYETEVLKLKGKAKEPEAVARARRWKHFCEFKNKPEDDPIVLFAQKAYPRSKKVMLQEATEMLAAIFNFTPDEAAFYTPARWSELLGAVLLNGQERSPNSEYVTYLIAAKDADKGALSAFHKKVRASGLDPRTFDASSHGQGIYPVGACFNHNCEPNIQVSYVDENDETLVVNALRPIEPDEELCISYIDENAAVEVRQQQLYEHYLFPCGCAKCARDLAELAKNGNSGAEKN